MEALSRTFELPSLEHQYAALCRRRSAMVGANINPPFCRRLSLAKPRWRLPIRPLPASIDDGLNEGIARFYDKSSYMWESLRGDHMHHGFYNAETPETASGHRTAQIRMVNEAFRFAGISDDPLKKPKRIVDVGCGIGGSSRYLANKYGAQVQGITLSPVQAKRAQDLAMSEALADKVSFHVADAIDQPFLDGQFDLVWSMESGKHMPDKEKFVRKLARVAAPGITIIIVTWCHRDLSSSEEELKPDEINLLNKLCSSFLLAQVVLCS